MDDSTLLETRELRKAFGGLVAVDGVSMRVQANTLHTIIGPNGAGKTTFFNLLSGNIRPTSGQVIYKGQDITNMPAHRRAHIGIGRSFQITNVFPNLSVFENVRLAAQAVGHDNFKFWEHHRHFRRYEEQANAILSQVGLAGQAELPARSLPHGGKRKLELGILLASDPELLLLDEPAAGLDLGGREDLLRRIDALAQDDFSPTVVMVTHHVEEVPRATTHVALLREGRLVAAGPVAEVLTSDAVSAAFGIDVVVEPHGQRWTAYVKA